MIARHRLLISAATARLVIMACDAPPAAQDEDSQKIVRWASSHASAISQEALRKIGGSADIVTVVQGNVELIEWMRTHNRGQNAASRPRLFGIDLSLGGQTGSSATAAPIECVLSLLERQVPSEALPLRQAFSSGVERRLKEQRPFTEAELDRYDAFIRSLSVTARTTGMSTRFSARPLRSRQDGCNGWLRHRLWGVASPPTHGGPSRHATWRWPTT